MQKPVLFAEEIDHRLRQTQSQQGQKALPLELKGAKGGKEQQIHDQKGQEKAMTEQHQHRGGVQPPAGRQEAEAPEHMADRCRQKDLCLFAAHGTSRSFPESAAGI